MILVAACVSLASKNGNGWPATYPTRLRPSCERRTCPEYFSVAFMYGGGHSIRSVRAIFIDIPLTTLKYTPGDTSSFTLAALTGVMRSPGRTSAEEGAQVTRNASASRSPLQFFIDLAVNIFRISMARTNNR